VLRAEPACPLVRRQLASRPVCTMQPRQYLSGSLTDNTSGVAPIILVAGAIGISILGLGLLLNGGSSPSEAPFWRMLSNKRHLTNPQRHVSIRAAPAGEDPATDGLSSLSEYSRKFAAEVGGAPPLT